MPTGEMPACPTAPASRASCSWHSSSPDTARANIHVFTVGTPRVRDFGRGHVRPSPGSSLDFRLWSVPTSGGPVELRFWDSELASVNLGFGSAGLVAPRVAEGPAWEHHECLGGGPGVHIPAGLVKSASEGLGEVLRLGFAGFEVEGGPDARLAACGALGLESADLADSQLHVLQVRPGAEALRYEGALDHERLLPAWACAVAPCAHGGCLAVPGNRSGCY